ncbi:hypothetical protein [Streptomyces sp. NPDC059008]|uniref:hypothetical protein n=1 Tax=Streptomyces sp. NPDC059008 TaxID=3346693 RepID=UPI0036BD3228
MLRLAQIPGNQYHPLLTTPYEPSQFGRRHLVELVDGHDRHTPDRLPTVFLPGPAFRLFRPPYRRPALVLDDLDGGLVL